MPKLFDIKRWKYLHVVLAVTIPLTSGCHTGVSRYYFLGKEKPRQTNYRENTLEVDHSDVAQPSVPEVDATAPPHTVSNIERDETWDMSLEEAVHLALANSDVIRSAGQFLSPGNNLLTNGTNASSVFDPAIQSSGVLFGGVGTEAALAEFDATLSTTLFYGRNETVQNNPFFGGTAGGVLEQDTGSFNTSLNKQFAYGAQFTLSHEIDYQLTNASNTLFPSTYTGNIQGEYRQQLLAGAGADFVRVAGPLSTGFTSITGVSNGVLIARINADISITQFEANVRDLVKDVEDTYWDLYLGYRNFDTSVTARNTALDTWRVAKAKRELGGVRGFTNSEESQARDRYFETRAQAENALGNLYVTEQRLRHLLGLPINDRKVIRPSNNPIAAKLDADWYHSLALGLTERVELRRQKWNIKSLELQLGAAKNFARPRLDLVAQYRVNGFGDHLLGNSDLDKRGGDLNTFYHKIAEGEETGYNYGLEFNMPFGLRLAKTQVRNLELRLTKARKVLAAQELEIGHELAVAFQQLETSYATAVSNYNRRNAALERVRMIGQELEVGSGSNTLDRFLRAQESLAAAENAYHQSLIDYNKAIVNLYYRQGTLLEQDNIHLLEGKWDPAAYQYAYARAKSRAHAIPAPHLRTVPPAFAADGHLQEIGFAAPEAAGNQPVATELAPYPEALPLPITPDEPVLPTEENSNVPQVPGQTAPVKSPPYFETDPKPHLIIPDDDARTESTEPDPVVVLPPAPAPAPAPKSSFPTATKVVPAQFNAVLPPAPEKPQSTPVSQGNSRDVIRQESFQKPVELFPVEHGTIQSLDQQKPASKSKPEAQASPRSGTMKPVSGSPLARDVGKAVQQSAE